MQMRPPFSPQRIAVLKFFVVAVIVVPGMCFAQGAPGPITIPVVGDPSKFTEAYRLAVGNWVATGQKYVTGLFAVIAAADLTWFGVEYWLNRYDFEGMMMASIRKIFAVGFFLALVLNATTWFPSIINGFIQLGQGCKA
jgi:type IV secretory pathway TrbL component